MHKEWLQQKSTWILIHLLAWSLIFLALLATVRNVDGFGVEEQSLALPLMVGVIYSAIIFYADCRLLAGHHTQPKKLLLLLLAMVLIAMAVSSIESFTDQWLYQKFSAQKKPLVFADFMLPNLIINLLVTLMAFAYQAGRNWMESERQKSRLAEEQLRTEMAFLQANINPHFLFNSLNTIYSETLKSRHKPLSEMVASLADLMRYMVYQAGKSAVTVSSEIGYIEDYIAIWNSRLDKSLVKIETTKSLDDPDAMICPMLFLPLVENAFKHGLNPGKTTEIKIESLLESGLFTFRVSNTLFEQHAQLDGSGFGLDNLKRRLNVRYPDKYTFEAGLQGERFVAALKLDLTHA